MKHRCEWKLYQLFNMESAEPENIGPSIENGAVSTDELLQKHKHEKKELQGEWINK